MFSILLQKIPQLILLSLLFTGINAEESRTDKVIKAQLRFTSGIVAKSEQASVNFQLHSVGANLPSGSRHLYQVTKEGEIISELGEFTSDFLRIDVTNNSTEPYYYQIAAKNRTTGEISFISDIEKLEVYTFPIEQADLEPVDVIEPESGISYDVTSIFFHLESGLPFEKLNKYIINKNIKVIDFNGHEKEGWFLTLVNPTPATWESTNTFIDEVIELHPNPSQKSWGMLTPSVVRDIPVEDFFNI